MALSFQYEIPFERKHLLKWDALLRNVWYLRFSPFLDILPLLCAAAARFAAAAGSPAAAVVSGEEEGTPPFGDEVGRYMEERCIFCSWPFSLENAIRINHPVPKICLQLFLVLTLQLRLRAPRRGGWEGGRDHPASRPRCRSGLGRKRGDHRMPNKENLQCLAGGL